MKVNGKDYPIYEMENKQFWLVVYLPLWKIMEWVKVNGKDDIPRIIPYMNIYEMENKSHVWSHQPDPIVNHKLGVVYCIYPSFFSPDKLKGQRFLRVPQGTSVGYSAVHDKLHILGGWCWSLAALVSQQNPQNQCQWLGTNTMQIWWLHGQRIEKHSENHDLNDHDLNDPGSPN